MRNTGPKRLSEASIQSFSARTGQAPSEATRRTVTVRSAAALAAEDKVDAGVHEADLLDVEADQRGTAKPGGGQQQQSPIAQAGEVAGTGGRHAGELGHPPAKVLRRRVAVRRACRSSAVTAGSDAGEASPCWRCWAAMAAARRASAPALSRSPSVAR